MMALRNSDLGTTLKHLINWKVQNNALSPYHQPLPQISLKNNS